MEADRTWVTLWCKDYAATANVWVTIEWNEGPATTAFFQLTQDADSDGMADRWEREMLNRWVQQYHGPNPDNWPFDPNDAEYLGRDEDLEKADPDGAGTQQVSQAEEGDAHTAFEEYRGYILDGGGFDGEGKNNHKGGHIRLDPARKELLLEVDVAKRLNTTSPETWVTDSLDGAAKIFSNKDRGAGIAVYYLVDATELDVEAEVKTLFDRPVVLAKHRRPEPGRPEFGVPKLGTDLRSDFVHVLFAEKVEMETTPDPETNKIPAVIAQSFEAIDPRSRDLTGVFMPYSGMKATNESMKEFMDLKIVLDDRLKTALAHELTHLLLDKKGPGSKLGSRRGG